MYHRNTGNWDEYWAAQEAFQICRRCIEFPGRRRKLTHLQAKKKYEKNPEALRQADKEYLEAETKKRELEEHLRMNGISGTPRPYHVPESMLFYRGVKTPPNLVGQHGESQLTHILKADHEWRNKLGTEDPGTVLSLAHRIAISTEPHVLQFTSGKNVAKYDSEQKVVVLIRESKESPTGSLIVTAFPVDSSYVTGKLKQGSWRSI
jgi:hypothetical protein